MLPSFQPRANVAPQVSKGMLAVQSTSLSINIQSACLHGESDLHCYFQSATLELRTKTFLYCWGDKPDDSHDIEQGADIFDGMQAKAREGLPETEYQSVQFALLLHLSINLSHHLELGSRQGDFNHIIDNPQSDFETMQAEVFGFFKQDTDVAHSEQPVYLRQDPRFDNLADQVEVKELKQPAAQTTVQAPARASAKPAATKKAPVAASIDLPKVSLPEVNLPKLSLPEVSLPKLSLPELNLSKPKAPELDFSQLREGAADALAALKSSFYHGPLNDAFQAVRGLPWRIKNGVDALADSAPVRAAKFGAEVVRAGIERTACTVRDGAIAGATAVASGAKALWDGAKRLIFSGYDRV